MYEGLQAGIRREEREGEISLPWLLTISRYSLLAENKRLPLQEEGVSKQKKST